MNQDFYTGERVIGKYNSQTLYRRIIPATKDNPSMNTDITMTTGLPLPSKIVILNITFNINNSGIVEPVDKLIRAYINSSGDLVVNQAIGNLARIVAYIDVTYIH